MKVILTFTLLIAAATAGRVPKDEIKALLIGKTGEEPSRFVDSDVNLNVNNVEAIASDDQGRTGRKGFSYSPYRDVYVVNFVNEHYPNGGYKFSYQLSDGSSRVEEGEIRNEGRPNQYLYVKGYYAWRGPDNVTRRVYYTSGLDGYQTDIKEN